MARAVGWVLSGIDVIARALGVSARTARRRAAAGQVPGAVKIGTQWQAPLSVKDYARGAEVSERTARRRVFARSASPTDPAVAMAMPTNLTGRSVKHTRGGRFVNSSIWPFQYQGAAWVRFLSSGDTIHWYTGVIVSKVRLTVAKLRQVITDEVRRAFSSSPVDILKIDYVYARQA